MQTQTEVFDAVIEPDNPPQPKFVFSFRRPSVSDIVRSAIPEMASATDRECWLYLVEHGHARRVGNAVPPIYTLNS